MILGVDIGGTFTDVVCIDPAARRIYLTKHITDHRNIVGSVIGGAKKILDLIGVAPDTVSRIVLGTTIATNVVVQRAGAKTSVFTTAGFEDVLEIGRLKRRSMYDLNIDVQTPVFLSPRRLRVGVPERLDAVGRVVTPLDEAFVSRAITEMREQHGIESVAVVYLFSFENNAHELRTREIIKSTYPDMFVSLSSEVNPIYREYERTVVTAFDAYMRPTVERGIVDMERQLRAFGITGEVQIMQSRGGVTTTRNASARPVNLFLSGPAGGVVGGARLAQATGKPEMVTIDIGGTSSDVALIHGGIPAVRTAGEILEYSVQVPMVDINTIGAGGGSLLRVGASGIMQVGPASAGSDPGPICYGRGGTEPTVTDASLMLGYLNPHGFAGGTFDLDVAAASEAITRIGERMNMSGVQVALGAHRIMNVQMAEQIRLITLRRGYDPRQFTLLAFGGAGPLHAGALMSMLGMKSCLIPPTPGVLSAYGLLNADIETELGENFQRHVEDLKPGELAEALAGVESRCIEAMRRSGVTISGVKSRFSADLRYTGQSYELPIPLREGAITAERLGQLVEDFQERYLKTYGHTNRTPIEIVNLRCVAYEPTMIAEGLCIHPLDGRAAGAATQRDVWFLGPNRPLLTSVLRRELIEAGATIPGPAVIEQADTTILIYPGQIGSVDSAGNIHITGVAETYTL